jgi:primosomal protein N' (replication factor Y)
LQVKFVSVVLPLVLPQLYSYSVPEHWQNKMFVGMRVEVSLRNKLYSAIVMEVHEDLSLSYKTKPVISLLDDTPIVFPHHLKFWHWIASYYACTVGEVMNVALPSGLKLESETRVVLIPDSTENLEDVLSDDEYIISEALSIQNELSIRQVQDILNKKTVFPVIRSLMDRKIITIKEELIEKYSPRMVAFATLNEPYNTDTDTLSGAFELLSKSEKQTRALLSFIQISKGKVFSIPVTDICHLADVEHGTLKAIEKKGILSIEKKPLSRIYRKEENKSETLPSLTTFQTEALHSVEKYFSENKPVLLHGVTGSGKTRIYAELIKNKIAEGRQVLYLLPEIALTHHLVERLKVYFGRDILVYHSRMNHQERVEVWKAVYSGSKVVVSARSGLFLPFRDLGLIIVDEEHDSSYKQNEPNPRYNARDAAIYLARLSGAKIILGSATPSMESYANAKDQKYALVELPERHGNSILPSIELVNLKEEYRDKRFDGVFSQTLITAIHEALEKDEQVLLFQNRRGYSPVLSCPMCDWYAECEQCDVRMTTHKALNEIRCHYCGSRSRMPLECPACGHTHLEEKGFGTEKIEELLISHFPKARVARLDWDTAKTKVAFENIIEDFENKQIDIIVGTQMITKGLDFDNISLVGVLNADTLLKYPDLRANERAFQLLTQVSGRAGRREKQGKVIIQTYQPGHPVITETIHHLYDRFYERESSERKLYFYPPFYRMIQMTVMHKKSDLVAHAAREFVLRLQSRIGKKRVLGPAIPSIARIRGMYIQTIIVKMEKDSPYASRIKKSVIEERDYILKVPSMKSVKIVIDVDPY